VSETGTTGVRRSPRQSASSTKRPFPLSDLRRTLLADTALRRRRRRRRRQDAKWRGRFGWRSRAASITRSGCNDEADGVDGFWLGGAWLGGAWLMREWRRRRVLGVTVGCKECAVECCCLNLTLFF